MHAHAISSDNTIAERTTRVLAHIFAGYSFKNVSVRLWNGQNWPDERPRDTVLALTHPAALSRMFLPGTEVGLAEAYLHNDFDIEGDIGAAFEIADPLLARLSEWKKKVKLAGLLVALTEQDGEARTRQTVRQLLSRIAGRRHSRGQDERAIKFHYDVSNDFYRLWLDPRMVYSCACFQSLEDGLDLAQEQKLTYLCHKLRLRPGQRLLDIGCGWGGLIIHAAKLFGVRAEGITLSKRQAEWAGAKPD